ncbi:hypothetical protein K470DRAFT_256305 [Piedraia hortae CBS 480.64]|uniref:Homeobox domain-containing protein n=1 Tax=Piedraia hortae CBS 480.64 TaxID=1314780 RepID=A0A6A7C5R4_9PEZI|nr:hypothetical protein K470DRAFT_256305 [Piedraia hortae CBS 480.64]
MEKLPNGKVSIQRILRDDAANGERELLQAAEEHRALLESRWRPRVYQPGSRSRSRSPQRSPSRQNSGFRLPSLSTIIGLDNRRETNPPLSSTTQGSLFSPHEPPYSAERRPTALHHPNSQQYSPREPHYITNTRTSTLHPNPNATYSRSASFADGQHPRPYGPWDPFDSPWRTCQALPPSLPGLRDTMGWRSSQDGVLGPSVAPPTMRDPFTQQPLPAPYFNPNGYEYHGSRNRKRSNLPKHATEQMKTWFDEHISNPYPSEEQKAYFSRETGITMTQVSNWFINHRRRCPELKERRQRTRSSAGGDENGSSGSEEGPSTQTPGLPPAAPSGPVPGAFSPGSLAHGGPAPGGGPATR